MCCMPTERLLIVLTLPLAVVVLSIGYRPLGSCPRTAGWSAATLCIGPSGHFVATQQLRRFGSRADIDFGARRANGSAPPSLNNDLSCRAGVTSTGKATRLKLIDLSHSRAD